MPSNNVYGLGLVSLLYVSRSTMAANESPAEIDDIVAVSRVRNGDLAVTGALIYSGAYFAQVLEGPDHAVAELMTSITKDRRHRDVTTMRHVPVTERMFPEWTMAYSGVSPYLDRHLKPLLSPALDRGRAEELVRAVLEVLSQLATSEPTAGT